MDNLLDSLYPHLKEDVNDKIIYNTDSYNNDCLYFYIGKYVKCMTFDSLYYRANNHLKTPNTEFSDNDFMKVLDIVVIPNILREMRKRESFNKTLKNFNSIY